MILRQPVLFVSHGAPDLLLSPSLTGTLWTALGRVLPRPVAILVISAHWQTESPTVSAAPQPSTIHDFSGFPKALYAMNYPAVGAVQLANRVINLLADCGIVVARDTQRGLDHGAWVPLKQIYPAADIPIGQLSISLRADPEWHFNLGKMLHALRNEGVLILASGAVTHNFDWLSGPGTPPLGPAQQFADWLADTIHTTNLKALLDYRQIAPHGAEAHPTEEHLLPLFVAHGAADSRDRVYRLAAEYCYGGLAMDSYLWQSAELPTVTLENLQHIARN
ncbi:4,5-DOPA dioxygenase extradiol [Gammaproteobacteria bacterium]